MKTLISIALFLIVKLIKAYCSSQMPGVETAIFGIDDALVAMGVSALAGGIGNLFGSDDEQKRYEALMKEIENRKNEVIKESDRRRGDLARLISSRVKGRRINQNAKLSQYGMNPIGSNYGNEGDLVNAEVQGQANIDAQKEQALSDLEQAKVNATLNAPIPQTGIEKFISGGLAGANLGYEISGALGLGSLGNKATGGSGKNIKGKDVTDLLSNKSIVSQDNLNKLSDEVNFDPELAMLLFRSKPY